MLSLFSILNNFQTIFQNSSKFQSFCGVLGSQSIITASNPLNLLEFSTEKHQFLITNTVGSLLLKKRSNAVNQPHFFHEKKTFLTEI